MNTYSEEVREDNKLLKQIKEAKDFKGISEIVANLIKMVSAYMENTQKEIENIKSILDLKFTSLKKPEEIIMSLEQKKENKMQETNKRIQNMIETIKEIKHNIPIINSLNSINKAESSNKKVLIRDAFIHIFKTHRNGIAVLKLKDKYTKIPLIPTWRFDNKKRRWIPQYKICSLEGTESFYNFYNKNTENIIHGRRNIINAIRTLNRIKAQNMIEYRKSLRNPIQNTEDVNGHQAYN